MISPLPENERREFSDGGADLPKDQSESKVQWHPFGGAGFGDAYCKVRASILFRFRCGDSQEFFACVQRDWRSLYDLDSLTGDFWAKTTLRRHLIWSEAIDMTYDAHGQKKAMLVDYVQSVEKPKEDIPSLVWFDTVEGFESLLPDSWYNSAQRGFVRLGTMRNWELCIGSDNFDQPAGEVIKRTTETMQYITGNEWDAAGDVRNVIDTIGDLSGLSIDSSGKFDRISFAQLAGHGTELLDVLLGPIVLV